MIKFLKLVGILTIICGVILSVLAAINTHGTLSELNTLTRAAVYPPYQVLLLTLLQFIFRAAGSVVVGMIIRFIANMGEQLNNNKQILEGIEGKINNLSD